MKAKNLTKAFVGLFVVAIVIGVLVWPTPKGARADEYTHYIVTLDANNNPVPFVVVEFRVFDGDDWILEPTMTREDGTIEYFFDAYSTYWQASTCLKYLAKHISFLMPAQAGIYQKKSPDGFPPTRERGLR